MARESWEVQKLRLAESEQAYYQAKLSAGIIASFASAGALGSVISLFAVLRGGSRTDPPWTLCIAIGSILLLLAGSAWALLGCITRKLNEIPHPDKILDTASNYPTEAHFYRQLIVNANAPIEAYRRATASIGLHLRVSLGILMVSMALSLPHALWLAHNASMTDETTPPTPAPASEMPPAPAAMDGELIHKDIGPGNAPTVPPIEHKGGTGREK